MEIKWLEDFVCLYRLRSFRKSAYQRAVSQSAFSRRIKALEEWLGADLIDRSSYPVEMTQAGSEFVETAMHITAAAYQARSDAGFVHREPTEYLVIATHPSLAVSFVPDFLQCLKWPNNCPIYKIRNDLKSAEDYLISLEQKTCDYLICYQHEALVFRPETDTFVSKFLKEEILVPVVSPIFDKINIDHGIPLVQYSPYTNLGKIVTQTIYERSSSKDFRIVAEASVAETLKAMVISGHGVAWLPQSYISRELNDNSLVVFSNLDHIKINIQLVKHKDLKNHTNFIWDQVD